MGILARLKRLWEMSGPPEEITDQELDDAISFVPVEPIEESLAPDFADKPKRMATIVHEDPLDVFPSHEDDQKPKEESAG